MGKTRATYRDRLQGFENDWKAFRRRLIREYQPYWDEILAQAHAAGQQNPVEDQSFRGSNQMKSRKPTQPQSG